MTLFLPFALPFLYVVESFGRFNRTQKWLLFWAFWFGWFMHEFQNLHREIELFTASLQKIDSNLTHSVNPNANPYQPSICT